MSTIRFSGVWSDRRFLEAANRLQQWIEDKDLSILDPFKYGYYNDPFTPAFLRRNEVLVPVIKQSSLGPKIDKTASDPCLCACTGYFNLFPTGRN